MTIYNYREAVLGGARTVFTGAQVVPADQIYATIHWLRGQITPLRLIRMLEPERESLGEVSAPEEVHLNQLYARLVRRFPQIMDVVRRPKDLMDKSLAMESNLSQLRGALRQYRLGARAAVIVLSAEQTEMVDRVEGAIMSRVMPSAMNATTEEDRSRLMARFFPQEEARDVFFAREQGRRSRAALRAERFGQELDAASKAQEALRNQEALRALDLAAPEEKKPAKAKAPRTAVVKRPKPSLQ